MLVLSATMFQISYDLRSKVDYRTQSVSVSTFDFGLRLLAHRSNYEILLLPNVWYELIMILYYNLYNLHITKFASMNYCKKI